MWLLMQDIKVTTNYSENFMSSHYTIFIVYFYIHENKNISKIKIIPPRLWQYPINQH